MDSLIPNSIDSLSTRITKAKTFLQENPTEKPITASRIYNITESTFNSSRNRSREPAKARGGSNKVLVEHQVEAIHRFIRSLLVYDIQPTHKVVFNAIISLKRAEDPQYTGPSERWFRGWWKKNKLHTIRSKPLAEIRFTAATEDDINRWFWDYRQTLKELGITKRKCIINFDEAGFRVGCMKAHKLLVPVDVREFYALSPENRKSVTIFECINAAGHPPPPPLIVIEGHDIMLDWFPEGLPASTRIIPSENGFTSNEIAVAWLQHYIEHSDSGPEAEWKLLLMDNHGSHLTPEFITLANKNHIRPYPLISHFTHCMQPLDVGVFQPYKHWHDMAIQDALAEFNIEYTLHRFLNDLTKIRENTFKKETIIHAFQKSGMCPPNSTACIDQLKTFTPKKAKSLENDEQSLPPLPPRLEPINTIQVEIGLQEWQRKIQKGMEWSDPARPEEFDSFVNTSVEVCTTAFMKTVELGIHQKRREAELKVPSRKRIKTKPSSGLGLTKEDATKIQAEKEKKEKEADEKKQQRWFMKQWRKERDTKTTEGVAARKKERDRIRELKSYTDQGLAPPPILLIPIPDPEAIWKAIDITWQVQEEAKRKKKEAKDKENIAQINDDKDVSFIIDTIGDSSLVEADFIAFEDGSIYEENSEDELIGYY